MGHASNFEDTMAKYPLKCQIVDGQQRRTTPKPWVIPQYCPQPIGNNRRMPIVTVDDIGLPPKGFG
jgi:hypothetical protein